jgi:hypothetical protein
MNVPSLEVKNGSDFVASNDTPQAARTHTRSLVSHQKNVSQSASTLPICDSQQQSVDRSKNRGFLRCPKKLEQAHELMKTDGLF